MGNIIDKIRAWCVRNFSAFGGWLNQFMMGRNGLDNLGRAMIWLYIILCFVRMFFAVLRLRVLTGLSGLMLNIIFILLLFRLLSKNLYKRQAENQKWLVLSAQWRDRWRDAGIGRSVRRAADAVTKFISARVSQVKRFIMRVKDREHKYFTCESCGAVCRVPKGKGKIMITCPRCGNQIKGKS